MKPNPMVLAWWTWAIIAVTCIALVVSVSGCAPATFSGRCLMQHVKSDTERGVHLVAVYCEASEE